MIEGYIGIPGAGKTLSMTKRAHQQRRMYDEIIHNYGLNPERFNRPMVRLMNAQHFVDVTMDALYRPDGKRRLILLDEVHSMLDARNWTKVPQEALMVLAQPRKARLDVLYTAQHESQVEKRLRVVTNWLWMCKSWGKDFNPVSDTPFLFWATRFEPFSFERLARSPQGAKQHYGRRYYKVRKKDGDLYDTMEVLERMDFSTVGTKTSGSVEY